MSLVLASPSGLPAGHRAPDPVPRVASPPAVVRHGWMSDQLPVYMADDPFFRRFISIIEDVASTVRDRIDAIEHTIDVAVAPPEVVRWMGSWLGMDGIDPTTPELQQRALVHGMGALLGWRGTKRGLQGLLSLVTGSAVTVRDNGGIYSMEASSVAVPLRREVGIEVEHAGRTTPQHLLSIVRHELPADCAFELHVAGEQVWPPPAAPLVAPPGGRRRVAGRRTPLRAGDMPRVAQRRVRHRVGVDHPVERDGRDGGGDGTG